MPRPGEPVRQPAGRPNVLVENVTIRNCSFASPSPDAVGAIIDARIVRGVEVDGLQIEGGRTAVRVDGTELEDVHVRRVRHKQGQ